MEERIRRDTFLENERAVTDFPMATEIRLTQLEETRYKVQGVLLDREQKAAEKGHPTRRDFEAGDLVSLRNGCPTGPDSWTQHLKFKRRWLDLYSVSRLLHKYRSALLKDLITGRQVGKYHFNHLKLFVPRREETELEEAKDLDRMGKLEREIVKDAIEAQRQRADSDIEH